MLPPAFDAAIEPVWSGLGAARFMVRLDVAAGSLLSGMIKDGTLPLVARMAMGFDGVSPRLPLQMHFDPAAVFAALWPHLPDAELTARKLEDILAMMQPDLPVEFSGPVANDMKLPLAASLADRLAARFGRLETVAGAEPRLVLPSPDTVAAGAFDWDLSVPFRTRRWLESRFDPFMTVRALVAAEGSGRLITESVTMPIPTGHHMIRAFANLQRNRIGIEALGVTVRADPAPPDRPQVAVATKMIEGTGDTAELRLQLAPGEPLTYWAQGFAVISDALGVRRLEGAVRPCGEPILRLVPADFGLLPLTVEAALPLLKEARIDGELRYAHAGREHSLGFQLDCETPNCTLGLPVDAETGSLRIVALALSGGGTLVLERLPAQDTRLDMLSFPGFGPHVVTIRCPLPPEVALVAIDLASDDEPDSAAETLAFTAAEPERQWHYFAASPFRTGYRWRLHAEPNSPITSWTPESNFELSLLGHLDRGSNSSGVVPIGNFTGKTR